MGQKKTNDDLKLEPLNDRVPDYYVHYALLDQFGRWMEKRGVKIAHLAKALGVSNSSMTVLFADSSKMPIYMAASIARLLNLELHVQLVERILQDEPVEKREHKVHEPAAPPTLEQVLALLAKWQRAKDDVEAEARKPKESWSSAPMLYLMRIEEHLRMILVSHGVDYTKETL